MVNWAYLLFSSYVGKCMENNDSKKVFETARIDDKDWFLQMLVGMANDGMGIGLSLNVGGLIVSGTLCGGKEYFYSFGEQLGEGMYPSDSDEATNVAKVYRNIGDDVYSKSESQSDPATYLHMKNAQFFSPKGDSIPSNGEGTLWRGKVSEIDGFSLGRFSKN